METYSFGDWIKQRRERLRLTQRQLASLAFCSVAMIKKIEGDERRPSPELAGLLAKALKIPDAVRAQFLQAARGEHPVDTLWTVPDAEETSAPRLGAPTTLPIPATPFVGRAHELTEVGQRLARPDCRLVTLVGPGGVGKTRLALAVAELQRATFTDGTAFVSLAAITDPSLVPDAVARSLGITLNEPPADQVLAYLCRRRLLLILDNCEQLDGDLGWLSALLNAAPDVKVLATSRERLHLMEEWVYAVPGLTEAQILFVETARRVKQDFDPTGEETAITRICHLVDNLPLAVELAASWTPLMSCTQIAAHIERDINILAAELRNVPPRHRSMQAVFDHSWNLLSGIEQNALMRLSVFRGGWQEEEASLVVEADLPLLRRLADKSLVRVAEDLRYDLHPLVARYAFDKLRQHSLEAAARQRHFDAYLALAARLDAEQIGVDALQAVGRFDRERDNLHAALTWALDSEQTPAALDMLSHLVWYWFRRGNSREAAQWLVRAVEQAGDLETVPMCLALTFASAMLFRQGRYGEAETLADRAVAMAGRLEDVEALIIAHLTYTFTSVSAEQALEKLGEGISLIEATGKLQHLLFLYHLAAATWWESSGRYAEAAEAYRRSLGLARQMGALDIIAEPLGGLGRLALQEGNLEEAYELLVEGTLAAKDVGYSEIFGAWAYTRLGLIQHYLGDDEAADRSLEQALQLTTDGRFDARGKLEALSTMSEVAWARGDVRSASDHLQASLAIGRQLYQQLRATQKFEGGADALPIDLVTLSARATLVAAAQGNDEHAATLYSIVETLQAQSRQVLPPPLHARLQESMAKVTSHLSAGALNAALDVGRHLSLSEALLFVLS